MLRTALEPLSKPRPSTADGPDKRSYGQRLGDGFCELLRRYLDSGTSPSRAGEKPHLFIKVDFDDLKNGTGAGWFMRTNTPISAKLAQLYACNAKVYFWGHSRIGSATKAAPGSTSVNGQPALSDGTRLFTGRTRLELELRDGGCAYPNCDRPASWCDGHHIKPWLEGGETTVANGVLVCGHHHRLIHQGEWKVRMADDGHPEFIPPDWIDPRQQPLRTTRLRT